MLTSLSDIISAEAIEAANPLATITRTATNPQTSALLVI